MDHIGRWISGFVIGLIGILGLFVASRAQDDVFYGLGLVIALASVIAIAYLIRKSWDDADAFPRDSEEHVAL